MGLHKIIRDLSDEVMLPNGKATIFSGLIDAGMVFLHTRRAQGRTQRLAIMQWDSKTQYEIPISSSIYLQLMNLKLKKESAHV